MILGIIPARAGSKRLPGKNKRLMCGRPLFEWSVIAARQSAINYAVVTTDDEWILDFYFPDESVITEGRETVGDGDTIYPEVFRLIDKYGPEWVVLLQPTSPLRTAWDIDSCIKACQERPAPSCVSVALGSPIPNGAVYVAHSEWLKEHKNFDGPRTVTYAMPHSRSIDINTIEDFEKAEELMKRTQ